MQGKEKKIIVTPEIARAKMQSWCAYQERSQYEAINKLKQMGLEETITANLLADLITDNFLNEERFAKAFVRGKFRIKHWGRNKIRIELRRHKVPEGLIKQALQEIDGNAYIEVLKKEIEKKSKLSKQTHPTKKYFALLQYLVARGFEADIVKDELKESQITDEHESGLEE